MGQRWIGGVVACLLALVMAACGDGAPGSTEGPSIHAMVECLKRAGGTAEALEFEPGNSIAAAVTGSGDVIFIVPLPEPGLAGRASRAIKEEVYGKARVGLMTTSTVDRGSTMIGVIGVRGVDGGVPSSADEDLSRECAIRPLAHLGGEQQA